MVGSLASTHSTLLDKQQRLCWLPRIPQGTFRQPVAEESRLLWGFKRLWINIPRETKIPFYPTEDTEDLLSRACAFEYSLSQESEWVSPGPSYLVPGWLLHLSCTCSREEIIRMPWYLTCDLATHHGTSQPGVRWVRATFCVGTRVSTS